MTNNQAVMAYVAVFGGITLFTVLLTVITLRARRADDAESLALRAADVTAQLGDLLVGPDFLWAVWQDTAKAAAMTILVRSERDEVASTINVPAVPVDGVLRHFELDGKRYEIRKAGPLSNRTCLREAGHDTVLLSADHATFGTTFFEGNGARPLFTLPQVSVLKRYRPVKVGEQAIGKMIIGLDRSEGTRVLTLPAGRFSILEQVFVLASG